MCFLRHIFHYSNFKKPQCVRWNNVSHSLELIKSMALGLFFFMLNLKYYLHEVKKIISALSIHYETHRQTQQPRLKLKIGVVLIYSNFSCRGTAVVPLYATMVEDLSWSVLSVGDKAVQERTAMESTLKSATILTGSRKTFNSRSGAFGYSILQNQEGIHS